MPRSSQTDLDPQFWERLRATLKSHMEETGLKQKELAPRLGIDPTTLNNFLNRQTNSINGLAVALACTMVDLFCSGERIGRVTSSHARQLEPADRREQLVLEFDESFELQRGSKIPTLIVRKAPGRHEVLRLAVRKVS